MRNLPVFMVIFASNVMFNTAHAAALEQYTISIKNHQFTPEILEVPAGQKFTLLVKNEDASAEEFESHTLKREKIIKGNSTALINLGPLKPGKYPFVGEFHESTAKGTIIVQ